MVGLYEIAGILQKVVGESALPPPLLHEQKWWIRVVGVLNKNQKKAVFQILLSAYAAVMVERFGWLVD